MQGYKGFDEDLKCRNKQYKVGSEYKEKEAKLCESGFHFCEYPLDVLKYYAPNDSRYCDVNAFNVSNEKSDDTKRVAKRIKINAEIGIIGLAKASVEYIKNNIDWDKDKIYNTGYRSASTNTGTHSVSTNTGTHSVSTNTGTRSVSTNTGNYSAATNTGYQSASTNTGNCSAATVDGKESVAISLGIAGKAKANKGSWIVLAEWKIIDEEYYRTDVACFQVDGEKVKENTFYVLKNGELKEA